MWQNLSGKHELYEFVIKSYRKGEMVINTKQFFQFALICSVFVFGVGVINYSYASTQQQIQHNHIVSNNQSNDLSSLHVLLNPDTGPVDDSKVPCVAFMVGREILPVAEPNYCLSSLSHLTNSNGEIEMLVGKKVQLRAFAQLDENQGDKAWETSNANVVTVDENGLVTAVGAGTATVIFHSGGFSFSVKFIVNDLSLQGISFAKESLSMEIGETQSMRVLYFPINTIGDKRVDWLSENPAVAKVSNGMVVAVAPGKTNIVAKVGAYTATCPVTVSKKLNKIYLSCIESNLDKDSTIQLKVFYSPEDTTEDKTVVWSSSDESVATVNKSGKVTTIAPGTATISAKVGSHCATCTINVNMLKLSSSSIEMTEGDYYDLTIKNNIESKSIIWTSNDNSIAVVDDSGRVSAVQAGETSISAQIDDKLFVCKVVVKAASINTDNDSAEE